MLTTSSGALNTLSSLGHRKNANDFLSLYLFTTALCTQLLYLPFDNACTTNTFIIPHLYFHIYTFFLSFPTMHHASCVISNAQVIFLPLLYIKKYSKCTGLWYSIVWPALSSKSFYPISSNMCKYLNVFFAR